MLCSAGIIAYLSVMTTCVGQVCCYMAHVVSCVVCMNNDGKGGGCLFLGLIHIAYSIL